jgi:hypothetical protein
MNGKNPSQHEEETGSGFPPELKILIAVIALGIVFLVTRATGII